MLQQTRVETVVPYFERFVRELPSVMALAEAPSDVVMSLWSGLGYYRRARMAHEAAQQIVRERGGTFPGTLESLLTVRGVGRYTAGAIASIAFDERAAVVDGNVARVFARLFAVDDDVRGGPGLARIWAIAETLLPDERAGDWNQALMELGATTCVPRAPHCSVCPLKETCDARARGVQEQLPKLRPKKKPIGQRRVALVATVGRKVVVGRRRPGGMFGGLWEPIVLEGAHADDAATIAFSELLGVDAGEPSFAGVVTHVLSHRRLATRVLTARLKRAPRPEVGPGSPYDAIRLVEVSGLARLGMSTLARKVLARGGVLPIPAPDN